MRGRRGLFILIGAVALAMAIVAFFRSHPCSDIFPCHDSSAVISIEQRELLLGVKTIFQQYHAYATKYELKQDEMPEPLRVRINGGHQATLTVAGPIDSAELRYAQEWYNVYHLHHGGSRPVTLRVVWNSGSRTQEFPVSDI